MIDRSFHPLKGPFSLAELCAVAGVNVAHTAQLDEDQMETMMFYGVGSVEQAQVGEISFISDKKYIAKLANSQAGAVLVSPDVVDDVPQGMIALVTDMPYRAYGLLAQHFYPAPVGDGTIHPNASIDETARLGRDVSVGAGAVIDANVTIGDYTVIKAGAYIGAGVHIGEYCMIGPNTTVEYCKMGNHVRLLAGAVIGSRGFGFASDTLDFVDIPQLGRVIIGDYVEIGANSTIDRGAVQDTVIGNHVRMDNMVHVAHNVTMGDNCVLVAQTAIAGSVTMEDRVVCWGQAGITGHLHIGADAQIMVRGMVINDVPAGTKVMGYPAQESKSFMKQEATLRRISKEYQAGKKTKNKTKGKNT